MKQPRFPEGNFPFTTVLNSVTAGLGAKYRDKQLTSPL